MWELTVRLVFSLAVVVGLILLIVRFSAARLAGRPDALIQVVQRQALSRSAHLSVVTVGSKVLVIGATEQQVTVLAELDPEELVEHREQLAAARGANAETSASASTAGDLAQPALTPGMAALNGSLLAPSTWKQAWAAATSTRGEQK